MSEHFYDNDFEKFLQQQVKQHRMYPSDAVWKGIYKQMHGYKRWPGLYFIAILMIAALTVCTLFMEYSPVIYPQQAHSIAKATVPIYDQLDPVRITDKTLQDIQNNQESYQNNDISTVTTLQETVAAVVNTTDITVQNIRTDLNANSLIAEEKLTNQDNQITFTNSASESMFNNSAADDVAVNKTAEEIRSQDKITEETPDQQLPDAVIKTKKSRSDAGKWQFQVYITPSMNYRKIVDEKPQATQFGGPMVTNYGVNANQVIRYQPGMGIEFGVGILYALTNKLKLKAGFQYNVRQYNIEAYKGNDELARIALIRGNTVDTINTVAKYRSSGASNEALLLNKYHQISLPIGIEYAVIDGKKVGINISGSLQPTYTFSQSSYLLTSDYKSYADGTSILRRWNLNSSLEATLSYKIGDFQWKFGPQLRYQHLPTYTSAYPIKEYLIDYGFRIGFTKTIK